MSSHRDPSSSDPVTTTAVLPIAEYTVHIVSGLLAAERRRRGTRGRRRALGCFRQAVLVLRWFCDGTRLAQLATDNAIGRSTAYRLCTRASTSSPRRTRTAWCAAGRPTTAHHADRRPYQGGSLGAPEVTNRAQSRR